MARPNIINPATGQTGYQVPGATIPTGWQPIGATSTPTLPSLNQVTSSGPFLPSTSTILPSPTLPQNQPSGNELVNFSKVMEDMLQQTKQNRAQTLLGVANSAIPTGALDAGSFGQLLGVAARSSTDFVKGSMDLYKSMNPEPKIASGDLGTFQQLYGRMPTPDEYMNFLKETSASTRAPQTPGVGLDNLTTKQQAAFNQIVNKFNSSPLVAAADRGITLKNSIDQVKANPSDGPTQLNLIYGYIQALDQYQSAVREGEIGLSQGLVSYAGTLQNYLARVQQGRPLDPKTALSMASGATQLIDTINNGAKMKEKQFASQAKVNGIEDAWNSYRSGFSAIYDTGVNTQGAETGTWKSLPSTGIKYRVLP